MTAPPLSRQVGRGRVYVHPETGAEHRSVTTVLGVIANDALTNWAAKRVAEYAADNLDVITALDRDAAVDVMKRAPWRDSHRAADVGTAVHAGIQARLEGSPRPVEVDDADGVAAAVEFLSTLDPARVTPEVTVFGALGGVAWAGTCDALVRTKNRDLVIVDWKNTLNPDHKGPYPEAAMQVAAYAAADAVAWPAGGPVEGWRMVPLDGVAAAWCVQLLPGGRYHAAEVLGGLLPRASLPFESFMAAARLKDAHRRLTHADAWKAAVATTRDRQTS